MRHMIRRVQIHAIPASREPHVDHDTRRAWLLREIERLTSAGENVLQTGVC